MNGWGHPSHRRITPQRDGALGLKVQKFLGNDSSAESQELCSSREDISDAKIPEPAHPFVYLPVGNHAQLNPFRGRVIWFSRHVYRRCT